jgi:hypothetical protein
MIPLWGPLDTQSTPDSVLLFSLVSLHYAYNTNDSID